jgi:alkaline phosphatase D
MSKRLSRRDVLVASGGFFVAATTPACSLFRRSAGLTRYGRPTLPGGVQSGDVTPTSAIVWAAADRAARMHVEWATTESFRNPRRLVGPDAVSRNGFTARLDLTDLPPGRRVFYRVRFENLEDFQLSEPLTGSFKTPPADDSQNIIIAWSGDTAGQGWGIDPARGGMPVYKAMADLRPDLFIHSGDTIYADIPLPETIKLPGGQVWRNILTPAKSKVAESLDDFRGNYAYNLLDENLRRFNASVPMIPQWDDHEVLNNWYPREVLEDDRYAEKYVDILAARARQAFFEYMPIRPVERDPNRVYRKYALGPLAEVFVIDQRSYRGPNSPNRQETLDNAAAMLGPPQLEWLKTSLAQSTALWKIIASDMPLSAVSRDGKDFEAWANADPGKPLGRELELASLLSFIKSTKIRNTVWITADVHFAANVHYHPDRATTFKDFDPFREFISGPLHAGGFGPNALDPTFGPEYQWKHTPKNPADGPGHGYALFGQLHIDAKSKSLRVTQHDIEGKALTSLDVEPLA